MVRTSTHKDEQYVIYELHVVDDHAVTAGEVTANAIEVATTEAHAIVIADEEYARAYAEGELITVASVTYAGTTTTVNFSAGDLVEGEIVDIYFPVTGTASGSLPSNTDTGKLSLPRIQTVQEWTVEEITVPVPESGTEREVELELMVVGSITLGLNRYGNAAMADFIAARAGKSNGDEIYLLIDVIDTTVTLVTHDLLLEAKVESYNRASQAVDSAGGIVTDTIELSFEPDVVTFDAT